MVRAVPVGHRIRARRQALGLTQAGLARAAGISPSYLNLIEHGRRSIGGALVVRIARALETDTEELSGREEGRLADDLAEMAADPGLAGAAPEAAEIPRLVGSAPELARAAVAAYRAYRDARAEADALADRVAQDPFLAEASHQVLTLITSIRSLSEILQDYGDMDEAERAHFVAAIAGESRRLTGLAGEMFDFLGGRGARGPRRSPAEEVDDLFHDHGNHFPAVEAVAESLRAEMDATGRPLFSALVDYLERACGVGVRFVDPEELAARDAWYDAERGVLLLSEALPNASWRFQAARVAGLFAARQELAAILDGAALETAEAHAQARRALTSTFAGALLFPRPVFLAAARALHYDVERLQERFSASFEQVCHRLASLHRAGEVETIPFHFLRTDIAGNISKRFSASGLSLPRYSGACPRWISHTAFLTPERVVSQVARLPDGGTFLFVAKASARPGGGWREPRTHTSVMIGCDVAFARHTVYGRGLDGAALEEMAEPVGLTCRQCPREDCRQRMEAPQAVVG